MKLKRLTALLLAGCLITPNIGRVIAVENTGNQAETGNEDTNDGIKGDSNPEDENNNSGNEGEEGNNPGTGNEGTGDGSEDNSNPEDGNGSENSGTEGEDETDNEGNGEIENPGEGEDNTGGEATEPEDPNQTIQEPLNTENIDEVIKVPKENLVIKNGVFYGISKKWFQENNPQQETLSLSIKIPSHVNTIAKDGFRDSYTGDKKTNGAVTSNDKIGRFNIVAIDFSEATNLTEIKSQAAFGCTLLTGILDLSHTNIKTIEKSAFNGCTGLTGVILPNSLEVLGTSDGSSGSVFNGCSKLKFIRTASSDENTRFELPESLNVIGKHTFRNTFPKGSDLKIKIPASVEIIGSEAFYSNSCFSQIYILRSEGLDGYDSGAFKASSTRDSLLIFPNSKTYNSTGNFTRITKTYPVELKFQYEPDITITQKKLFGQSIQYSYNEVEQLWYIDENYTLPELNDVNAIPGYDAGWKIEGATSVLTNSSKVDGWQENQLKVEIVNDAVVSQPTVQFTVNGEIVPDETSVAQLEVTLDGTSSGTVGVDVSHPLATEDAKAKGTYVYFQYAWWDEKGGVNGPRSQEPGSIFSSSINSNTHNRIFTDPTIEIRNNNDERIGGNYYLVEIFGYYVKNGIDQGMFYKSRHNFLAAGDNATPGSITYLMNVHVTEDTPVIPEKFTVIVENGSGGGEYETGATVHISADSAPSGQVFDHWEVVLGGVALVDATNPTTSFTMPSNDVTVRATYKDDGNGGDIDPPVTDHYHVDVVSGSGDGEYEVDATVQIVADPAPSGQVFDRWVVESGDVILDDAADPTTSFNMPASNVTVRATYKDDGNGGGTDPVFDYRVDVENGTLENGRDYGYFESGETVEIFADEIEGQRFVRWETETRGVTFEDETDPTTSFIMPRRNVTVVAVYESEPTDPSEPTEPGEPTDPQEPTEPSEPIDPVEPTEPTEPSEPEIDETPDTGARQSIALWLMLGISLMGIAAAFVLMKKEKLNK